MKTISRTGSAKISRLATGEPPPEAVTAASVAGMPNVMEQSLRVGAGGVRRHAVGHTQVPDSSRGTARV
ncbi:hypothetical protein GCM10009845_12970 [Pedococcus bigeumensis]